MYVRHLGSEHQHRSLCRQRTTPVTETEYGSHHSYTLLIFFIKKEYGIYIDTHTMAANIKISLYIYIYIYIYYNMSDQLQNIL
jgi:hypothetical protein